MTIRKQQIVGIQRIDEHAGADAAGFKQLRVFKRIGKRHAGIRVREEVMHSDVIFKIAMALDRLDPVDRLRLHRRVVFDQNAVFVASHLCDQLVIFLEAEIQPDDPDAQMDKRR